MEYEHFELIYDSIVILYIVLLIILLIINKQITYQGHIHLI